MGNATFDGLSELKPQKADQISGNYAKPKMIELGVPQEANVNAVSGQLFVHGGLKIPSNNFSRILFTP
jgi:hypothetical protein